MARPCIEIPIGARFGRLTVLSKSEDRPTNHAYWLCHCECGVNLLVAGAHLRRGNIQSCGCLRHDWSKLTKTTHGMAAKGKSRSKIYSVWNAMKQRCHNPRQPHYPRYGGRGIYVCDEWRNSFAAFYRDMGDPPFTRSTLDRIDNDGPYAPGNVRWASYLEQATNKRKRARLEQFSLEELVAEIKRRQP